MRLSMVMPAFNVGGKLKANVLNTIKEIQGITDSFEIIIVNDGSTDNTAYIIKNLVETYPKIVKSVRISRNTGKGYALRQGFAGCEGEIIGFIDADGDINPKSIKNLYRLFVDRDSDVVVGSKNDPKSVVKSPLYRKMVSGLSQRVVRLLFDVDITDSQAGIKLFKKEVVKKILPYLRVSGYAFDVEILSFASKFGYKKIFEAPIDVSMQSYKHLSVTEMLRFAKEILKTSIEFVKIFVRLNIMSKRQ